jgi:hypothetical protein
MITIHVGNLIVTFDSPEEAAKYTALLNFGSDNRITSKQTSKQAKTVMPDITFLSPESGKHDVDIKVFLKVIKSFPEPQVSSGTLAEALNLESVNGLGPRLRSIGKRFKATYHQPLEKVIERVGPPGQFGHWKINKDAIEKIN